MVKILSRRSPFVLLAIIAFVLLGIILLRRSADVSARRTGGTGTTCVKEGSQGESPLVCCTGLTQLGDSSNFTCTKCGNGKCGTGETQLNCSQDCVSCLKEGESGEAPLSCCRGLTQLGDQYEFVCAKCGNRKCGTGETESNCPQDCKQKKTKEGGGTGGGGGGTGGGGTGGGGGGKGSRPLNCGNAIVDSGEECDTGTDLSHGCTSNCTIWSGWKCTNYGGYSMCSMCGNGVVESGEECDAWNSDGCSKDCKIKEGYLCRWDNNGQNVCDHCGNGVIDPIEDCDDNLPGADNYCRNCQFNQWGQGWNCLKKENVCYKCGDGVRDPGEECDTGPQFGDYLSGCTSDCRIQEGFACNKEGTQCARCGDGQTTEGIEECDDRNSQSNDGCSDTCKMERGWTCTTECLYRDYQGNCQMQGPKMVCGKCGDGRVEGDEKCDDGNAAKGDGCSSTCEVENGWTCVGNPAQLSFCIRDRDRDKKPSL